MCDDPEPAVPLVVSLPSRNRDVGDPNSIIINGPAPWWLAVWVCVPICGVESVVLPTAPIVAELVVPVGVNVVNNDENATSPPEDVVPDTTLIPVSLSEVNLVQPVGATVCINTIVEPVNSLPPATAKLLDIARYPEKPPVNAEILVIFKLTVRCRLT